jgi:hypothetical protein
MLCFENTHRFAKQQQRGLVPMLPYPGPRVLAPQHVTLRVVKHVSKTCSTHTMNDS